MPPGNFRFYNMITFHIEMHKKHYFYIAFVKVRYYLFDFKDSGNIIFSENGKSVFCLLTRLYNINRDQTSHVGNVEIKEKEVKCHVKVERRKGKNKANTQ